MRKKDEANTAHLFKRIHEMFDVARRIDQPVAAGVLQEIAVSAERRRRIKPRVVEILVETERKTRHGPIPRGSIGVQGTNRADRTCYQRLVGAKLLRLRYRLTVDTGILVLFVKGFGGKLAAGIAINTRRVDKEIASDIARQFFLGIRHTLPYHAVPSG